MSRIQDGGTTYTCDESEIEVDRFGEAFGVPRNIVVRLLAQEASDRLQWEWTVERFENGNLVDPTVPSSRRHSVYVRCREVSGHSLMHWCRDYECSIELNHPDYECPGSSYRDQGVDALLGMSYGYFLLMDEIEGAK